MNTLVSQGVRNSEVLLYLDFISLENGPDSQPFLSQRLNPVVYKYLWWLVNQHLLSLSSAKEVVKFNVMCMAVGIPVALQYSSQRVPEYQTLKNLT